MENLNIEDGEEGLYNKPLTKFVSTCEGIVGSGKRKGEICGCNTIDYWPKKNTFCKRHDGSSSSKKKQRNNKTGGEEVVDDEVPGYRLFDPQEKCSICLDEFGDRNMNCQRLSTCGHLFHRSCIMKWIQMDHFECPLCRDSMSVYTMYIIV